MPTSDNLTDMSWSDRRQNDQQHFNANRDAAQARITERLRRGGLLPDGNAATSGSAGASFGPAPKLTVRDVARTLTDRSSR